MLLTEITLKDGSQFEKSVVFNASARMGDHCMTNQNDIEYTLNNYPEVYIQYYDNEKQDWIALEFANSEIDHFRVFESDEFDI